LVGSGTKTASIDSRESTNFAPELIVTTSNDSKRQLSLLRFEVSDNATLSPGPAGSWDENIRERGWFMYDNGIYHAWYGGWRGDYNHNIPNLVKLGYATSIDGVNWTKHPDNPIYDETWIEDICVVKHDGTYYMYAEDEYTDGGNHVHIVLYTSTDGISWTKHGPVLQRDGDGWEQHEVATPVVWKEDGSWFMLYEGIGSETAGQIGLATSADGINWTRDLRNPVLANPFGTDRDIAFDSIIKRGGIYFAYGHYRDARQQWIGGVFTSCDLVSWTLRSNGEVPNSSAVILDTGNDFLLYGPDFDGRAPFRLAHARSQNTVEAEMTCRSKANYALRFDGIDDQVVIEDNELLSGGIGKSITVEAWIKPDSISGTRPIIQKFLNNEWKDWGLQIKDGGLEVAIENSGNNWNLQAGSIAPGKWSHVAFTFDNSTDVVRLLINGSPVGVKQLSKNMPNTEAAIRIGQPAYFGFGFAGEIDEVRIWSVARSSQDIDSLRSEELTGNEKGLIAYWQMNHGDGQRVDDLTSGNNYGSLGTNRDVEDPADPEWVASTAPLKVFLDYGSTEDGDANKSQFSRVPGNYALYQNYPNPFNPETSITIDLPENAMVELSVFDILGRKVVTLVDGERTAGHYRVDWNGRDAAGRWAGSGVYFYCLRANAFRETRKMALIH
jgi:hypothetical protein